MKFDACPVEPPGLGSGPLSSSTSSLQPSLARWRARLLPTMPAPISTARAVVGSALSPTSVLPAGGGAQLLLRGLLLGIHERLLDDYGANRLVRPLDLELGPELGVLDRHHRVADVLLEPGRVAGRGHLTDAGPVLVHGEDVDHLAVVVRAEPAAADLDPH